MPRSRRVALIIETSNEYARGLLHGIRSYLHEHGTWEIYLREGSRGEAALDWLARWKGDGIIARMENSQIARAVMARGLPVIDLSAARLALDAPMVETDDAAIATLAAEHLLERGYRHLAFCGDPRFRWSQDRRDHFTAHVHEAGHDCHVYPPRGKGRRRAGDEHKALATWVNGLPKPVGIMACYDMRGRQILEACREIGVAVPDQVAVIGVDNDELLCDLSEPPLSSIAPDSERTGYVAAELLDRMMAGRKVAPDAYHIKPLGIVCRQSTDALAVADLEVIQAVRFIREAARKGIKVEEVVEHVGLSRRALDARFRRWLGHTVHDEIRRVQLDLVKQLLVETQLPLTRIAAQVGFDHVEYLSVWFKRETGQPPSVFREAQRKRGGRGEV
ncbi:MAG: DNA-binding transcriptional regulator [Phycisphaeraceae bacterium]